MVSINSMDDYVDLVLVGLGGDDLRLVEAELSGEIFVQYGDLALCVISRQLLRKILVVEGDEEIRVRLPLLVVYDFNGYDFLRITFCHLDYFLQWFVVHATFFIQLILATLGSAV